MAYGPRPPRQSQAPEASLTISVVVPAYNASGFILRALASALEQSHAPLEIIVVDDASSDDTAAVVESFAKAEPRVRLLRLARNGGPSAARNAGLAEAKGDWIAILDADDAFEHGRLTALHEVAQSHQADMAADNILFYDMAADQVVGAGVTSINQPVLIDPYLFLEKSQGNRQDVDFGLLKPMFRRAFLDAHQLRYRQDVRHGEDFIFYLDCLLAGARWAFTPAAGYRYTQRWGAVSGAASGMSRTRIDYAQIVAQTRLLLQDNRVRRDRRLVGLLRERLRSIQALHAKRRQAAIARKLREGWSLMVRDPGELPGFLRRALGKAVARPSRF